MTLVEFLTARLDEDEALARAAIQHGEGSLDWGDEGDPTDIHIARHDPARVLREVEAKRAIVRRHASVPVAPGRPEATCVEDGSFDGYPCPTLRLLAGVYSDHPDYDESWRP